MYTDGTSAYKGLPNHESVKHSVGEYVRGQAHTNGMESFWAVLKRGYHHWSPKHMRRYIAQFVCRHNARNPDTIDQMQHIVAAMVGKRLMYKDLVA